MVVNAYQSLGNSRNINKIMDDYLLKPGQLACHA